NALERESVVAYCGGRPRFDRKLDLINLSKTLPGKEKTPMKLIYKASSARSERGSTSSSKSKKNSARKEALETVRKEKDNTVMSYIGTGSFDSEVIERVNNKLHKVEVKEKAHYDFLVEVARRSGLDMSDVWEVENVLKGCISKVEEQCNYTPSEGAKFVKMPMRTTEEMNWRQRTAIIFFLLHPLLGNNDETACCSIFNVNKNTLQGWLHKQGMRFRWRKYIDKYTVKSVMDYMGEKWKQCSKFKVLTSKQMDEKLPNHILHKYRCKEAGREILFFSSDGISVQQKVARAKRKKDQYVFLKVDQKRAHTNLDRKTGKYAMEKQWVASELCSGWNVGFPLTTAELSRRLRQEFFEGSLFDAHMLKNDNKTLNQWLRRAVDDAGFSSRCSSFASKIPIGWG
ncbi:MAG: hypothetical protein ACREOZ_05220, partial [Gloeomargaritales cyanobacterium]